MIRAPRGCRTSMAGRTLQRSALKFMTLLEQYIAGWRAHDANAILNTLHPDCEVIESFGPIYRGHAWAKQWIAEWLAEDGRVLGWAVHDVYYATS
ncbi:MULTISPECIES: nuclear transport factor 2 family protein [unclassified Variovorax]|uniref:nuclear transport factor 2 family protein n=1 Tax=unclassified Variovorax TaxID=663243 RepID=UPI0033657334